MIEAKSFSLRLHVIRVEINGSKHERTRRCIQNRRNGKIHEQLRRHNEDGILLRRKHQKIANINLTQIWNPAVVWRKRINPYWTKETRSAEWKTIAIFPNSTSQDACTITSQMCAKWLVTLTHTVAFFDQQWASIWMAMWYTHFDPETSFVFNVVLR